MLIGQLCSGVSGSFSGNLCMYLMYVTIATACYEYPSQRCADVSFACPYICLSTLLSKLISVAVYLYPRCCLTVRICTGMLLNVTTCVEVSKYRMY